MKYEKEQQRYFNVGASSSEKLFENTVAHSRLFRASRFDRFPACASFETDFVDGTVLSLVGKPSESSALKVTEGSPSESTMKEGNGEQGRGATTDTICHIQNMIRNRQRGR